MMAHSKDSELHVGGSESSTNTASPNTPKLSPTSSSYLDDNYEIYRQHAGEELDPEEAKKVLRKIDRRILPVLIVIYLLQYLDKNGINYASVYGLEEGTHLEGQVRQK